ncbi:MAG: hypothetical protein U0325_03595 [Polyangiales bacterium]
MSLRLRALAPFLVALGCAPSSVTSLPPADASSADSAAPADAPASPDAPAADVIAPVDTPAPIDVLAPVDVVTPIDAPPPIDAATADVPVAADVVAPTDAPAPLDVRPTACTTSSQCAAPQPVCDVLRGQCAQCTTATACPAGQTCAAGRCVAAVACTSSRMCPGQVCDTASGRCVDCTSDPDCASGERCRANLCVPPARMCRSSRECSDLNQVCHPTRNECVDCAADNDCTDGLCRTDNTCGARVCTPNARTCAGPTAVRVCDSRGAGATDTACAGNEVCSAGRCIPRVCAPNAADCAPDGARRVCNADGLGYTTSACTGTQVCAGGQCLDGCPGGLLRCGGACVDLRNDANNCGACGVRCGAGEACVTGREGCLAACVPATPSTVIEGTGLTTRLPAGFTPRQTNTAGSGRGVAGEDAATNVAYLIGRTGPLTNADLAEAVVRVEGPITQLSTVRSLMGGQRFTLADGNEAMEERIVTACTSATTLRDRIASSLAMPTAGTSMNVGVDTSCVVDVSVTRSTAGEVRVSLAVTSRTAYDTSDASARWVRDLAVFAMPQGSGAPAAVCATLNAAAPAPVDVLWLQDTSGSLTQYQARVARGADAFLQRFVAAGLDARVAVLRADATAHNVEAPGLTWVTPAQTGAAQSLCDRLTSPSLGACPLPGTDMTGPYPGTTGSSGSGEEPTAGSITNTTNLVARAARGETNVDRRIRAGARVFTLGLTDESGSNDYSRYFQNGSSPDTMQPWGTPFSATVLGNIAGWFTRNNVRHYGFYPHRTVRCGTDVFDLPRCVASASGGAYADLPTTTDADTQTSMSQIVDAIAAEVATVRLPAVPVSGVARVTVRGMDVPRSRVDGYDLDPVRRAVLFYGTRYRPAAGEAVRVTFPAW